VKVEAIDASITGSSGGILLRITLTDVVVTSLTTTGGGASSGIQELVGLDFVKICVETPDVSGSPKTCYDRRTGEAS
jgi:type VI protein secretion system component Hcp